MDDLEPVYRAASAAARSTSTFRSNLVELPGDLVQLYVRDPAGNLVEIDCPGVDRLPAELRAQLKGCGTSTRRTTRTCAPGSSCRSERRSAMAVDLVIDIENTPGALAQAAAAISDAGVNIAAATCIGTGERAELHIRPPRRGRAHSLAISHLAISREREVVVVDVEDRPGVLADLTRRIARAGVNLDLVYVATRNRVVFGAPDLDALKAVLAT